jgi:hypothetical protein
MREPATAALAGATKATAATTTAAAAAATAAQIRDILVTEHLAEKFGKDISHKFK